jgi:uncharacterized protein (TIGR02588 family)
MAKKPSTSKNKPDQPGRIEWLLAAIAATVVMLLFGFLAVEALVKPDTTPTLMLEAESSRKVQDQTYVEVVVRNLGHSTAADVEIEGTANGDDRSPARATLDYAPAQSAAIVTLVFEGAIAIEEVAVRVVGFRAP